MDALLLSSTDHVVPGGIEEGLRSEGLCVRTVLSPGSETADVTVNWGYTGTASLPGAWVVNPPDAVRTAHSVEEAARILSLHGIPVPEHVLPHGAVRRVRPFYHVEYKHYSIHVADLTAIKRKRPTGMNKIFSREKYERIVEIACRSVYLLGLHYGEVHLLVSTSGEATVSHIDPAPHLISDDLALAYGAHLARSIKHWLNSPTDCTPLMGADPEFTLTSRSGRPIDVSKYVQSNGAIGYDSQSLHGEINHVASQSRRSIRPIVEIRPDPDPSPVLLAHRIQNMLNKAIDVLPVRGTKWSAGSFPFGLTPIGGHIHFSGIPLTTPLLHAFDAYVAIPLMLLERRIPAKRRRRRYGRLGDFRRKSHGGFEYRTLSSWLVCPQATVATLALAKVIANEWRILPKNPWAGPYVAREFYLSKKMRFQRTFLPIWNNLQQTDTGDRYEKEIDYVRHMIASRREWDEEADLKSVW